eukprot:5390114-Pleurochrysis_carterae.AAC.1
MTGQPRAAGAAAARRRTREPTGAARASAARVNAPRRGRASLWLSQATGRRGPRSHRSSSAEARR